MVEAVAEPGVSVVAPPAPVEDVVEEPIQEAPSPEPAAEPPALPPVRPAPVVSPQEQFLAEQLQAAQAQLEQHRQQLSQANSDQAIAAYQKQLENEGFSPEQVAPVIQKMRQLEAEKQQWTQGRIRAEQYVANLHKEIGARDTLVSWLTTETGLPKETFVKLDSPDKMMIAAIQGVIARSKQDGAPPQKFADNTPSRAPGSGKQALVNRLARGDSMSPDDMVKAQDALNDGIYPTRDRKEH